MKDAKTQAIQRWWKAIWGTTREYRGKIYEKYWEFMNSKSRSTYLKTIRLYRKREGII